VVEVGARIELDLVADHGGGALAGRRGRRGDGQHRPVIDIGVVGEDVDREDLVLGAARGVRIAAGPSLGPVTVTVIVEESVAPCSSTMA
jgi:hypothetical protein